MKTLTISEATSNLADWLQQAVAGEEIGIRSGNTLVVLRPLPVAANGQQAEPLLPREALRCLQEDARHALDSHRQRFRVADTRLRLLSPQQVLERGFSITKDAETGEVIRDAKQVRSGQRLKTRLAKGEVTSTVESAPGILPGSPPTGPGKMPRAR